MAESARRGFNRPTGMKSFLIVWSGQFLSLTGSGMTVFALSIYIWQLTGQATSFALLVFFGSLPQLVFSPFAGALVDRWNRKLTMMLADIAGFVVNIATLALIIWGNLLMWHLYALAIFNGVFLAFQWPAYSAAISLMIEKKHFARASALLSLAQSGSTILAPIIAAVLIISIGIPGIIMLDAVTFLIAIGTLIIVLIPQPPKTGLAMKSQSNIFKEAGFGFRYIFGHPSLLGLQLTFFFGNLLASFAMILATPMILAHTNNNPTVLGTVQTVAGIGGVLGGLLISIWGGPKLRIRGVIGGWFISFCGIIFLGLANTTVLWAAALFLESFSIPLVNTSNQAIWQSKIPPEIQGKVFSARLVIAQIAGPFSMLVAGPLADRVFEPALSQGGSLSQLLGPIFGVGPGSGMSFMISIAGCLGIIVAMTCYLVPAIRRVEKIVPDFTLPEAGKEGLVGSGAAPLAE